MRGFLRNRNSVSNKSSIFDPFWRWKVGPDSPKLSKSSIYEEDGNLVIETDLPGFTEDDISVVYNEEDQTLTISGSIEETDEVQDDDRKYHVRREKSRSYKRSFRMPNGVDPGEINAHMENGVLTTTVEGAASENSESSRKEIPIDVG